MDERRKMENEGLENIVKEEKWKKRNKNKTKKNK